MAPQAPFLSSNDVFNGAEGAVLAKNQVFCGAEGAVLAEIYVFNGAEDAVLAKIWVFGVRNLEIPLGCDVSAHCARPSCT